MWFSFCREIRFVGFKWHILALYFLFEKLLHCGISVRNHNCWCDIQNVQLSDFINLYICLQWATSVNSSSIDLWWRPYIFKLEHFQGFFGFLFIFFIFYNSSYLYTWISAENFCWYTLPGSWHPYSWCGHSAASPRKASSPLLFARLGWVF